MVKCHYLKLGKRILKTINQVIRETGWLVKKKETPTSLFFIYNGIFYEIQLPLKQIGNCFVTAYGDSLFDCFEIELTEDTIKFFSLEEIFYE